MEVKIEDIKNKRGKTYATTPCRVLCRGMVSCVCLSFLAGFFFVLAGASAARFAPRDGSTTWPPISAEVEDIR